MQDRSFFTTLIRALPKPQNYYPEILQHNPSPRGINISKFPSEPTAPNGPRVAWNPVKTSE